ncbi:uncharacterized protein EV422DRAFT_499917 [Fimicolochytrium jonesii]|uniref:uncharacterized protein n=1 Tax=Fimicolochytrium jonesii TaxID=1396493 RepID=UPI0022FDE89C|nr:uncharacterized protein EV422DRAFT_499917 [Fimicolochytrium jonesii]KAI8817559.1 hypothetical protein EV422DRAFT_499917 [Fimicolochytrium jonesii]
MVRLTGLSLDPEFPPHHHNAASPQPGSKNAAGATTSIEAPAADAAPNSAEDGEYHADETAETDGNAPLTLRAVVSTREAGVIIGKGGKNVAEIRDVAGVKAGVSKVIHGVHERILTVSGTVESLAKGFYLVAKHLIENPIENSRQREPVQSDTANIHLLVSHQLMGSIIGKGGSRIRDIQEQSGAKITVSKDMLPQSTERVIDIYGNADAIQTAVEQISECILNDIARAAGTIYYYPENRHARQYQRGYNDQYANDNGLRSGERRGRRGSYGEGTHNGPRGRHGQRGPASGGPQNDIPSGSNGLHVISNDTTGPDQHVQTIAVPNDVVGAIIGRSGSFINQIRKSSNARLRINEQQEGQTTRTVTITGSAEGTKIALEMIYNQLEAEKQRRLAKSEQPAEEGQQGEY